MRMITIEFIFLKCYYEKGINDINIPQMWVMIMLISMMTILIALMMLLMRRLLMTLMLNFYDNVDNIEGSNIDKVNDDNAVDDNFNSNANE